NVEKAQCRVIDDRAVDDKCDSCPRHAPGKSRGCRQNGQEQDDHRHIHRASERVSPSDCEASKRPAPHSVGAHDSSYDVSKDPRRSPGKGASIIPRDEPTVDRASMTFRRGLPVTTAIQAAALLAAAVFVLLASRWLGSEGKGTQAILVSGGQLIALVLSFGLGSSMPYIVSSDIRLAGLMALRQGQLLVVAAIALAAAAFFNRSVVLFPSVVGLEGAVIAFTISTIAQTSYSSLALSSGRLWTFNVTALLAALV